MRVGVLSLKTTSCANGETFEFRLFCDDEQIGRSVFQRGLGQRQNEIALGRILHGLIESRHKAVRDDA